MEDIAGGLILSDSYPPTGRVFLPENPNQTRINTITLAEKAAKEAFYTLLGKSCEELEGYPDAIAIYITAMEDTGTCEDYLYGLHRAYRAMGDSVQAAEYLKQAQILERHKGE